jgi:hypothetical protein
MKKPDNVSDNPGLLPYASNVGATVIYSENIDLWKQKGVLKVNRQLKTKFLELKEEYQKLVEEYKWNDLVYNAKFSFEPVIGQIYHLYPRNNGEIFLSLIAPNEWGKESLGSFRLNSEQKWIKL